MVFGEQAPSAADRTQRAGRVQRSKLYHDLSLAPVNASIDTAVAPPTHGQVVLQNVQNLARFTAAGSGVRNGARSNLCVTRHTHTHMPYLGHLGKDEHLVTFLVQLLEHGIHNTQLGRVLHLCQGCTALTRGVRGKVQSDSGRHGAVRTMNSSV